MMNYLKENKLQLPERPKFIKPNDLLYKVFIKNKQIEEISFEELFQLIFNKLSPTHEIKKVFADRTEQSVALFKGKFQPVEFKLESRGGNKKVTSIYNLWQFQLDANTLQSKFRKEIGCSVSLGETTKPDEFVICVQGNQIHSISQILKSKLSLLFDHNIFY
jgi:translation initiation factor 1 (eIF-1/SUI1)